MADQHMSWIHIRTSELSNSLSFDVNHQQVLLFGVMAIEIKRKAPHAHTVCEIVKARYASIMTFVCVNLQFLAILKLLV